MTTTVEMTEPLVRTHIHRAIADVFGTMLGRVPLASAPDAPAPAPALLSGPANIAGSVGFVGDINGLVSLHLDLPFARFCTTHLLGMSDSDLDDGGDEMINDAIGELANMTVGSFKNGLGETGCQCRLALPSVVRGRVFSIEAERSRRRHVYWFEVGEHRILVDVLIKAEN